MNKYSQHSTAEANREYLREYHSCREKKTYTQEESVSDTHLLNEVTFYQYYHCKYCHKFHRASTTHGKAKAIEGVFVKQFTKIPTKTKSAIKKPENNIDWNTIQIGDLVRLTSKSLLGFKMGNPFEKAHISILCIDIESQLCEVTCVSYEYTENVDLNTFLEKDIKDNCFIYLNRRDVDDYLNDKRDYAPMKRNSVFCKGSYFKKVNEPIQDTILVPFSCLRL